MRVRIRAVALAGILALGGLTVAVPPAHAQCGGGGGGYGRAWGGHTFNPRVLGGSGGYYSGGYGSGGCEMMTGGMTMGSALPHPRPRPRRRPARRTPARCIRAS